MVGFDGSPSARSAALWAAEEAASRDCGLLLVHVVRGPLPELVFTPMSTPLPDAVSEQSVRSRAENDLADLTAECNRLSPGLNITTRIEYGHPTDVLGEIGRNAELLVVGSSGRSGLTRALLGSTAADLAVHHEHPVVVVREAKAADGRGSPAHSLFVLPGPEQADPGPVPSGRTPSGCGGPPPAAAPSGAPELAATGAGVTRLALSGLLSLLIGTGLVLIARQRPNDPGSRRT